MTATADMILERRRARRKLAYWRVGAILALVALALVLIPGRGTGLGSDHVARILIQGVILDDRDREQAIRKIADTGTAKAMIVEIASPGGTVVGSEVLYDNIRAVAEAGKPVVALVSEVAASGGYITALAADRIVTRRNSITGSIGVISQIPNVAGLMEQIGVSVTEVKSSPLKAAPSPFSPPSQAALDATEEVLLDSYAWFRDLVGTRRGLEGAELEGVSDGRVFTGHQAMELGLVDEIGGPEAARSWLAETHGISRDLPVVDYTWGKEDLPFPLNMVPDSLTRFLPALGSAAPTGPRLMALYTG